MNLAGWGGASAHCPLVGRTCRAAFFAPPSPNDTHQVHSQPRKANRQVCPTNSGAVRGCAPYIRCIWTLSLASKTTPRPGRNKPSVKTKHLTPALPMNPKTFNIQHRTTRRMAHGGRVKSAAADCQSATQQVANRYDLAGGPGSGVQRAKVSGKSLPILLRRLRKTRRGRNAPSAPRITPFAT
jgi:hypothetical protein